MVEFNDNFILNIIGEYTRISPGTFNIPLHIYVDYYENYKWLSDNFPIIILIQNSYNFRIRNYIIYDLTHDIILNDNKKINISRYDLFKTILYNILKTIL